MASYQDIESRLRSVEDKLDFLMTVTRMRFAVSSGVVGPDGQPIPSTAYEGTLKEIYNLSRSLPYTTASEQAPPPLTDDDGTN